MIISITLDEAAANFPRLVNGLTCGDEVLITKDQRIVAKLVHYAEPKGPRPPPGFGKESLIYMAPDFDGPMEEFKEYEG